MIYLDNAATTKPSETSLRIYNEINVESYFNPSAGYSCAFNLSKQLTQARKDLITILDGDEKDNIIFTSGATESNNLAIFGSNSLKTKKFIFSEGEHPSVYNCAVELKSKGYNVEFVPLQNDGQIDYNKLDILCDENICFVSTMFVSNETGAINDLKRIRQIIDKYNQNAVFHVDAVQGFCKLPFSVKDCKINLCSLSAHKIGGIKGVGALYVSNGTRLKNINFGGGQEYGIRSGTVNAAGILSFVEGAKDFYSKRVEYYGKAQQAKEYFIGSLENNLKNKFIVASNEKCSPYIVSLMFPNHRGETIMRYLDSKGIIVGTGSACSTNKVGNRVLASMGYSKTEIIGAIRLSFFDNTTIDEIDNLVKELKNYFDTIDA